MSAKVALSLRLLAGFHFRRRTTDHDRPSWMRRVMIAQPSSMSTVPRPTISFRPLASEGRPGAQDMDQARPALRRKEDRVRVRQRRAQRPGHHGPLVRS